MMSKNTKVPKKQPDCDFIDYCGDKAIGQVKYGSEIKNVCLYHAQELCEDSDEFGGIDDSLEMFV